MSLLPFSRPDLRELPRKPVIVILVSTICLIGINFLTNASTLPFAGRGFQGEHYLFYHYTFWALASSFFYLALPIFAIKVLFKERLRDYGLKRQQFFGYFKVYLLVFLIVFPLIVMVSFTPEFQSTYPFYFPLNGEFFYYLVWEFFYVVQFFALEFFFRGFMVHGLKKEMGLLSVFVMMVPYCMIHFGKPLPECVGSIFAGIFLGLMSYKTRSVWMGGLLHAAAALSMNWLSLWHRGYF
ncbi:MAG TPA: CPBP family intramembrane glutamic endopeptidase [Cyclobacteriaceae bacterium]|jgi:membrane protease YdiL (CAAX protease family)|nr:CPBP family intramembrane glutamic endopeptidase [Cyclobacteriaceae bacterium]